jgi:hypothetical protein
MGSVVSCLADTLPEGLAGQGTWSPLAGMCLVVSSLAGWCASEELFFIADDLQVLSLLATVVGVFSAFKVLDGVEFTCVLIVSLGAKGEEEFLATLVKSPSLLLLI